MFHKSLNMTLLQADESMVILTRSKHFLKIIYKMKIEIKIFPSFYSKSFARVRLNFLHSKSDDELFFMFTYFYKFFYFEVTKQKNIRQVFHK